MFGEHAVVYGRPALAVPVTEVQATAHVREYPGSGVTVRARDLDQELRLVDAPADHPLAAIVRLTLQRLSVAEPDWHITVSSTIPMAGGLGSGAAVSTAIVRALAAACGHGSLPAEQISQLVYEVERLHHGTPSGIDNTVIAFEQPVYFVRGEPPVRFHVARPFMLLIADSGVASPTRVAVADVRHGWERAPQRYEMLFDEIARVVDGAHAAIIGGTTGVLGPLMNVNQELLAQLGVSSPEIDRLVLAALQAGASGAKLSGAGRGGNVIATAIPEKVNTVAAALEAAGARRVIVTAVAPHTAPEAAGT